MLNLLLPISKLSPPLTPAYHWLPFVPKKRLTLHSFRTYVQSGLATLKKDLKDKEGQADFHVKSHLKAISRVIYLAFSK